MFDAIREGVDYITSGDPFLKLVLWGAASYITYHKVAKFLNKRIKEMAMMSMLKHMTDKPKLKRSAPKRIKKLHKQGKLEDSNVIGIRVKGKLIKFAVADVHEEIMVYVTTAHLNDQVIRRSKVKHIMSEHGMVLEDDKLKEVVDKLKSDVAENTSEYVKEIMEWQI